MMGGVMAGFAMSLLVLDYTGSTLYFALYNILYFLPYVVMPLIAGPYLDRFSRKRAIYTLDYTTAVLYGVLAFIMHKGFLNFAVLAGGTLLFGCIGSVYQVAYESFYPLLITEGNYSRAYSVASVLQTLTMAMIPVSALVYNTVGIVPLFVFNVFSYSVAATFEYNIKHEEEYVAKRAEESAAEAKAGLARFVSDFKEGMEYLASEKGLMAVAIYFSFSYLADGASQTVTLPYFKGAYENGEYIFILVWGIGMLAKMAAGIVLYRHALPQEKKYSIALGVYITINLLCAFYLFTPIPVMVLCCIGTGVLGLISYNIRISGTQRYVPDEKKGRFNGAFNTLSMIGTILGQLLAGILSVKVPLRLIVVIFQLLCCGAAIVFIGGNQKAVSKIYNTAD